MYDPAAGRFASEDPVEGFAAQPWSLNPYAHAGDAPLDYADADGRLRLPTPGALAKAGAAAAGGAAADGPLPAGDVLGLLAAATIVGCDVLECAQTAEETVEAMEGVNDALAPPCLRGWDADEPIPASCGGEPEPEPELGAAPGSDVLPGASDSHMGADSKIPASSAAAAASTNGSDDNGPNYPDPKFAKQLERQLEQDGPRSIDRSLRSLEKRLAEHRERLPTLRYKSSVEREIRNFEKQIETIRMFKRARGLE